MRAHRVPLFSQSYALVTRIAGRAQPPQELALNGPEVQGDINPAAESDLYTFRVTTAGTYTIETSGTTDTFLSLFGPNSSTNLIATDDDSGPGTLSLLVQNLNAGQYFVQVRHFSSAGTGRLRYRGTVKHQSWPGAARKSMAPKCRAILGSPRKVICIPFMWPRQGRILWKHQAQLIHSWPCLGQTVRPASLPRTMIVGLVRSLAFRDLWQSAPILSESGILVRLKQAHMGSGCGDRV